MAETISKSTSATPSEDKLEKERLEKVWADVRIGLFYAFFFICLFIICCYGLIAES